MAETTVNIKVSWREANLILEALKIASDINSKVNIDKKLAFTGIARGLINRKEK